MAKPAVQKEGKKKSLFDDDDEDDDDNFFSKKPSKPKVEPIVPKSQPAAEKDVI